MKYLEQAQNILETVSLEKENFISNWKGKHNHLESTVRTIAFSNNGRFIVTVCDIETRAWKKSGSMCMDFATIRSEAPTEEGSKPLAAINNLGSKVIVFRRELKFEVYNLDDKGQTISSDVIDLMKEIRATIDKSFFISSFDIVHDLRITQNQKLMRVDLQVGKKFVFVDARLSDSVVSMVTGRRY